MTNYNFQIPEAVHNSVMNLIVSSRIEGQHDITIKNIAIMSAMELPPEIKVQRRQKSKIYD
jgi:hypothetical protein